MNTAIQKPKRPLLERLGGRFLRAPTTAPAMADDPIHVLNPVERAGLLRVTRGAVLRAAFAGVLNAACTGFGALFAAHVLGHRPEHATLAQSVSYWGLFGALALVAAVPEIGYLYWDSLRAVRELSAEAYQVASITPALEHVERLRRAFVAGDAIPHAELLAAAP